jgi:cyclic pyranopterin phosphate synthase
MPGVWSLIRQADLSIERTRHSVARVLPVVVRPQPRQLHIAITAHCNQRCIGCRYGRDFMPGSQLEWPMARQLLDDAADAGFWEVRLYGGEPLLHRDLERMVAHTVARGMRPYVTTNAVLLRHRIDGLYQAGLRHLNIGFYGVGASYNEYVQRSRSFERMEAGIAAVRDRYGMDVAMRINWLLMRPSCNLDDLDLACRFAEQYRLRIQVDLVHYSLPYFSEGPDRELQFRPEDRPNVERVADDLLRRQREQPDLFFHSAIALRSIPDWVIKGPAMRVPCDASQMVWVGADGSVQLCYVTFPLGNLHQTRLRDMMHTAAHRSAVRGAFALDCPNCHCGYDTRIEKDAASARHYARLLGPP